MAQKWTDSQLQYLGVIREQWGLLQTGEQTHLLTEAPLKTFTTTQECRPTLPDFQDKPEIFLHEMTLFLNGASKF